MNNQTDYFDNSESRTLKDYINLIRANLLPVILITLTGLVVAIFYAVNAQDIYKSTTVLKVSKPQGSILNAPLLPEFQDYGNDRFISNEIEIMKSYSTRERVAAALTDSFKAVSSADSFALLIQHKGGFEKTSPEILPINKIAELLSGIDIEQKRGLDIVEITVESPSPFESKLIANTYSEVYKKINLEINRNQLTLIKNFLEEQKEEKQNELNAAEEMLRSFQEQGGIVALDEQVSILINQLSGFEAQRNAAMIDLTASNKVLENYKLELEKQNPKLADYLASLSSESYFKSLQDQLVKLQISREVAKSSQDPTINKITIIEEYDRKIKDIQERLNEELKKIKAGIFASSPEEVKELSQKIIEEEVKNQALKTTISELEKVIKKYEDQFNRLPKTSIELARLQRNREALEKLYILVEERYQEAVINEQSQPGNVLIIDNARRPYYPSKPNRILIVLVGLVLGGGIAFGYVFIRNYFDNTVKTPEDIQNRNINVLSWIPQIEGIGTNGLKEFEFIVAKKPDSIPSEAFRALRTRLQFSKVDPGSLKTILITSAAPQEGKTTITVNLAGSFAQANKKVLLLDCDLRKPRIHTLFNAERIPGLIDYLFDQTDLNSIIRKTEYDNLHFVTSGTIPPNPAEMLDSARMRDFLNHMKQQYDIILIDSPPIIAVTDSEILASMVDGTIVVVSAEITEIELLEKSIELVRSDKAHFLGTVLNNFSYKSGYGSYYKYYYYYSKPRSSAKT